MVKENPIHKQQIDPVPMADRFPYYAVSYTHLDVYKRQKWRRPEKRCWKKAQVRPISTTLPKTLVIW